MTQEFQPPTCKVCGHALRDQQEIEIGVCLACQLDMEIAEALKILRAAAAEEMQPLPK